VTASRKGFARDFVWERYHAKGRLIANNISVTAPASLKERRKGVKFILVNISLIRPPLR
jgi:hypothetical protein